MVGKTVFRYPPCKMFAAVGHAPGLSGRVSLHASVSPKQSGMRYLTGEAPAAKGLCWEFLTLFQQEKPKDFLQVPPTPPCCM